MARMCPFSRSNKRQKLREGILSRLKVCMHSLPISVPKLVSLALLFPLKMFTLSRREAER